MLYYFRHSFYPTFPISKSLGLIPPPQFSCKTHINLKNNPKNNTPSSLLVRTKFLQRSADMGARVPPKKINDIPGGPDRGSHLTKEIDETNAPLITPGLLPICFRSRFCSAGHFVKILNSLSMPDLSIFATASSSPASSQTPSHSEHLSTFKPL